MPLKGGFHYLYFARGGATPRHTGPHGSTSVRTLKEAFIQQGRAGQTRRAGSCE